MRRDVLHRRNILTFLSGALVCLIVFACSSQASHKNGHLFSSELKEKLENELRKLPDSKLIVVANVTTKNVYDTLYIQSVIANRLMSSRMRHEANFQKALEFARLGYDRALYIEDTIELVKGLNELGTSYRRVGSNIDALEAHYKAMAIASAYSDSLDKQNLKNLTYAYNGIGNIALSMHNNEEAKKCFQKGIVLEREIGSDIGLAINYANLGSIMQDEQKYDSAFYYITLSHEMNEKSGSLVGVALCHEHFGSLFEEQNLLDSARVRYKKSYDMLISSSDKWHWLVSCVSLGRVSLKMGDLAEAEKYLVSARDIATYSDATESLEKAHELLAELYRRKGDFTSALKEVDATRTLNETIRKEMQNNTFNNAQIAYLKEKQNREVQLENERNEFEKERHVIWFKVSLVVAFVLMLLVIQLTVTFKGIHKRNRMLKRLQDNRNKIFSVITSEMKVPAMEQRDALRYLVENFDELARDEQRQNLIQVYGSAVKQVDQLSNLLTWTHIQLDDVKPNPMAVNLCQVVTESIDMLHQTAKQKNISFALPYDNGMMVYADPDMVSCIVLNLLSNAIKYSYSGGEISIKYKDDAFAMMLYVEDHGIGLDEKQLAALLSPLKGHETVDIDKSSGIGLKICVELARKSNGAISAESRPHRGSTFILTLPKPNV